MGSNVSKSLDSFNCRRTLTAGGSDYVYYDLVEAEKNGLTGIAQLPYSMKVLLENMLRFEDGVTVTPEDVQAIVGQLENPLRWAMMVRDPLTNWTQGRITLLGDAAHPTLPFLAQGAAMAIEDACVIARALERYADDPAFALQAYQATRIERTTRIVNGSAANTKRFHNPQLADPDVAARYVADEWQESKVRQRYEWLFSYEPENVPLAAPVAA